MTVLIRKQLHQLIDTLPEKYLQELWRLVQRLQLNWESNTQSQPPDSELLELITKIQNTPPTPNTITLPTKSWATYATEISNTSAETVDAITWNKQWDELETEMKANSLAHELTEQKRL